MKANPAITALALLSTFGLPSSGLAQGSLTPPGAPVPTMKTLDQLDAKLEKRTTIASLPFTIAAPGSYFLATNLFGVGAISIAADHVTLDLNGFTLGGGPGSATGVYVASTNSNLCIRNGVIVGRGGFGVDAGNAVNSQFLDLRIMNNGSGGLQVGEGCQVLRCQARSNIGHGIAAGSGVVIRDCISSGNTNSGINTSLNALVEDCQVSANGDGLVLSDGAIVRNTLAAGNGGTGFVTGKNAILQNCQSANNTGSGIFVAESSQVLNCVTSGNGQHGIFLSRSGCLASGCEAARNNLSGIYVFFPGCQVLGNTCTANNPTAQILQAGIYIDDNDNRIDGNQVTGNGYAGIQVAGGYGRNIVIRNTVAGNGARNYIDPGANDFGPIGSAATATSPWANISH